MAIGYIQTIRHEPRAALPFLQLQHLGRSGTSELTTNSDIESSPKAGGGQDQARDVGHASGVNVAAVVQEELAARSDVPRRAHAHPRTMQEEMEEM
jgi:hypothetical protein